MTGLHDNHAAASVLSFSQSIFTMTLAWISANVIIETVASKISLCYMYKHYHSSLPVLCLFGSICMIESECLLLNVRAFISRSKYKAVSLTCQGGEKIRHHT